MKKARIAAKEHKCARCFTIIRIGHVYLEQTWKVHYAGSNQFVSRRTCSTCWNHSKTRAQEVIAHTQLILNVLEPIKPKFGIITRRIDL